MDGYLISNVGLGVFLGIGGFVVLIFVSTAIAGLFSKVEDEEADYHEDDDKYDFEHDLIGGWVTEANDGTPSDRYIRVN